MLLELVAANRCDDGASETVTAANAISLVYSSLNVYGIFLCHTVHCVHVNVNVAEQQWQLRGVESDGSSVCMLNGGWYSLLFRIFKHWVAVAIAVVVSLVQKATSNEQRWASEGMPYGTVCKFRNAFYWFYTVNMPARDRKIPKLKRECIVNQSSELFVHPFSHTLRSTLTYSKACKIHFDLPCRNL